MHNFFDTLRKLFPSGRAYRLINGSSHNKLIRALSKEPERIIEFYDDILSAGIPDGNLQSEVLPDWERFLGLVRISGLSDADRNNRIKGQYAAYGGQGPDYIQNVLQAAGFPVYVKENIPIYEPSAHKYVSRLGWITLGQTRLGAYTTRIDPRSKTGILIAGNIGGDYDLPALPERFIYIFFLCGAAGIDHFVDLPASREYDFYNLVLQIKPAHTWVLAQVNFV
ncbi:MAG: DUF2313 domain-containing protein [Spirochaetes bacterium]|nr:DUF2313 domain-containing protein [Spirochaetota bacterium]